MDLDPAFGAFLGAFVAGLIVGVDVRGELRSLRAWAHDLSDHLAFKRPARPSRFSR